MIPMGQGFKYWYSHMQPRDWWQNLHFSGSYSFILASKLKALKGILKVWNIEVFGRVDKKKRML